MEGGARAQAEICRTPAEAYQSLPRNLFANLTPWQKTLVARHPQRPYTLDFIAYLFEDLTEIHGDRKFADDAAIVAGFARFRGTAVLRRSGIRRGATPKKRSFATSDSRAPRVSARRCA